MAIQHIETIKAHFHGHYHSAFDSGMAIGVVVMMMMIMVARRRGVKMMMMIPVSRRGVLVVERAAATTIVVKAVGVFVATYGICRRIIVELLLLGATAASSHVEVSKQLLGAT